MRQNNNAGLISFKYHVNLFQVEIAMKNSMFILFLIYVYILNDFLEEELKIFLNFEGGVVNFNNCSKKGVMENFSLCFGKNHPPPTTP